MIMWSSNGMEVSLNPMVSNTAGFNGKYVKLAIGVVLSRVTVFYTLLISLSSSSTVRLTR